MAAPGTLANPKSIREFVLADLYRGQRLVTKVHPSPIDPQLRIASPEGDWAIAITLPDDQKQRAWRLALVSDFMAWKLAPAFIIASELYEPDCVYAMGVSHKERYGCLSRINRKPILDFRLNGCLRGHLQPTSLRCCHAECARSTPSDHESCRCGSDKTVSSQR